MRSGAVKSFILTSSKVSSINSLMFYKNPLTSEKNKYNWTDSILVPGHFSHNLFFKLNSVKYYYSCINLKRLIKMYHKKRTEFLILSILSSICYYINPHWQQLSRLFEIIWFMAGILLVVYVTSKNVLGSSHFLGNSFKRIFRGS